MVAERDTLLLEKALPLFKTLHDLGIDCIPYKSRLCFAPLIRHIEHIAAKEKSFLASAIMQKIEAAPELREPIEDETLLDKHEEVIQMMMSMLIPPALRHTQLAKVSAPFEIKPLYMTPAVEEVLLSDDVEFKINNIAVVNKSGTIVLACSLILNKFYNKDLAIEPITSFTVKSTTTGIERHYKAHMNMDYVDVHAVKKPKPLTEEQINQLLTNIYDVDLWLHYLPLENFNFHGIIINTLVDITEEEALSRMKQQLLRKDAIVESANISELECLVKTYFNLPDLRLGVTAIDYPLEKSVPHKYKIRFDFLADEFECLLNPEHGNSIYEKACKYRETLLIEDLEKFNPKTVLEEKLLEQGIRSIIVAPLIDKGDQVIGLLELGSPQAYELHSFVELKLKEVTSLFNLAVARSREEIDNRIEALLRAQYTAVHPSVEWRFIQASYNLMEKRDRGDLQSRSEPIIFKDVFPLYGQADIVGSSTIRNNAIQSDMLENLSLAQQALERSFTESGYPLINQLLMKVQRYIERMQRDFNSNDETAILDLLQSEVHPMLRHMRERYPDLASTVTKYFDRLDPELGIVYRDRKAFEDSVAILNQSISTFLEQEERRLQLMLPHYFEKYQTDGVEFEMYVGQSLLRRDEFTMMHLRNFRLWQMIAMCDITRRIQGLENKMPVALTTAQLIFAYTTPLSIRFRMDEKQFDVDGAYNVRYEILKKRIDKATIEGTDERLTQAGKIAIVYLQEKDRQEYLEYIEYLQHEGLITGEVEDLQIGKLQGAQGLRALRVTVNL